MLRSPVMPLRTATFFLGATLAAYAVADVEMDAACCVRAVRTAAPTEPSIPTTRMEEEADAADDTLTNHGTARHASPGPTMSFFNTLG